MAITINGTDGFSSDNSALKFDTSVFVIDETNNRIGVNTASPSQALDVTGDIEVSGGVYVGGTGSANYLDDYEEGTWTPTFNNLSVGNGTLAGVYTKIGNAVTVKMSLLFGSTTSISGNVSMGNLPFANGSNNNTSCTALGLDSGAYWVNLVYTIFGSSTSGNIWLSNSVPYNNLTSINATSPMAWTTNDRIDITATYTTA